MTISYSPGAMRAKRHAAIVAASRKAVIVNGPDMYGWASAAVAAVTVFSIVLLVV